MNLLIEERAKEFWNICHLLSMDWMDGQNILDYKLIRRMLNEIWRVPEQVKHINKILGNFALRT